ncbi:MAG: PilZ domain-containing protein [Pseudomonadota bacterium]
MASFREQAPTERFEKRKLYRFPVQLPVQIGHDDDMSSICTNLSTSGASIETALSLTVGERFAITVTIAPDEEPLRMVGQIMWRRDISAMDVELRQIREMGVRFLKPLPSLERNHEDPAEDLEPPPELAEEEDEYIFPR